MEHVDNANNSLSSNLGSVNAESEILYFQASHHFRERMVDRGLSPKRFGSMLLKFVRRFDGLIEDSPKNGWLIVDKEDRSVIAVRKPNDDEILKPKHAHKVKMLLTTCYRSPGFPSGNHFLV